jgi:hypothetical protein
MFSSEAAPWDAVARTRSRMILTLRLHMHKGAQQTMQIRFEFRGSEVFGALGTLSVLSVLAVLGVSGVLSL